jgi:hypothetical protein
MNQRNVSGSWSICCIQTACITAVIATSGFAQTFCTLLKVGDPVPPVGTYGTISFIRQVKVNTAGTWVASVDTSAGYHVLIKDRAVFLATDPVGGTSAFDFFDQFALSNSGDVAIVAKPHSSGIDLGGLFLNSSLVEQAGDATAGSVYVNHNSTCMTSSYVTSPGPGFIARIDDSGTILDRCIVTCGEAIETTLLGFGAQTVIALDGDHAPGTGSPGETIGGLAPGSAFAFNNLGHSLYVAGLSGSTLTNGAIYLDSALKVRKGDTVPFDPSSVWQTWAPADINDSDDFTFMGDTTSGTSEFKIAVVNSGVMTKVVQQTDPAPSSTFLGFGTNVVITNSGDVFFYGVWSSGSGYFLHDSSLGTNSILVETNTTTIDNSTAVALDNSFEDESWMSKDGRFVVFQGRLNSDPTPNRLFLMDQASPAITFCLPGQAGVMNCPCSNAPGANGGCNNSSGTGGAELSQTGTPSLTTDTVQLTSVKEKPTATSIFLQGSSVVSSGAVFGQGIRCVGGSLKRLYVKSALASVATAPVLGDSSIHNRSAALGDTISSGTSRYYQTYYRDPTVLGGCAGTSTFNVTQALALTWTP